MGRWMEIRQNEEIIGEIAPHPILDAGYCLTPEIREQFPLLTKVWPKSKNYVDEELWLSSEEAKILLEEFRKLRAICRREQFITHLDGKVAEKHWRGHLNPDDLEWEKYLDTIESLLAEATDRKCKVRLML